VGVVYSRLVSLRKEPPHTHTFTSAYSSSIPTSFF